MNSFNGCNALITGATAGLGREFARQLAPRARTLILVGRRQERLDEIEKELGRPGLVIQKHAVNLADHAQLEQLIDSLSGTRIDLLVNNAGLGDHGLFEESEWPRVQEMIDVNIRALTRLTHALLPKFVQAGRGAILNVSSVAGLMPVPRMTVYAATKAFVSSFSEALRAELRGTGVTVTALCPGPIKTEFFDRAERPGGASGVPTPPVFVVPAAEAIRDALDAAELGRARVIPGLPLWITVMIMTLVPITILRLLLPGRKPLFRVRPAD